MSKPESDKTDYVNQSLKCSDPDTTASGAAAPDPHQAMAEAFRAAVQPDFRYGDLILEAAKTDPVTETLVLAYVAVADEDLRSRLILAMGIRQGELMMRRKP